MKFALRFWRYQYKALSKKGKVFYLILVAFVLLLVCLHMIRIQSFDIAVLITCLLLGVIGRIIPQMLCATIITFAQYGTSKVLNAEGFSDNYLKFYEKKRIVGRPYNENTATVFAEIMVRSGHVKEAMQYFEIIKVLPANTFAYTELIYLRMLAALKADMPQLADSIWNQERKFITWAVNRPARSMEKAQLLLVTIYADCANGRYERALQQTVTYMQSKEFKRYKTAEFEFRIAHLFILKKLGREEFNNIAPEVKRDIETKSHLYDWEMEQYLIDFNKAVNGVFPWQ